METAVAMLEEGCPLDVVSGAGATVLDFAAAGGNVELVRELVGRPCSKWRGVKPFAATALDIASSSYQLPH